jgi:tetratricopeptide repeat protein
VKSPPLDDLEAALRRVAGGASSPCASEEQLVRFYAGGLAEAEADEMRDHLSGCARCVEVGRDARSFLASMGQPDADSLPESGRAPRVPARPPAHRQWRPLLSLAAMALLAAGLWLGRGAWPTAPTRPRAGSPSSSPPLAPTPAAAWRDLPVAKAGYRAEVTPDGELDWRGEDAAPDAATAFPVAMEPYVRDDFAVAERRLAGYLARHPRDPRALFYRGVSLLLLGRAAESIEPLERAASRPSALAGEAGWYLALACLKSGDTGRAAAQLRRVEPSSPHRPEADALLDRLRAAPSP